MQFELNMSILFSIRLATKSVSFTMENVRPNDLQLQYTLQILSFTLYLTAVVVVVVVVDGGNNDKKRRSEKRRAKKKRLQHFCYRRCVLTKKYDSLVHLYIVHACIQRVQTKTYTNAHIIQALRSVIECLCNNEINHIKSRQPLTPMRFQSLATEWNK